MSDIGTQYIRGKWEKGNGPLFESHDPATGKMIWRGNAASTVDINRAIEAGRGAFEKWSQLSVDERIEYLTRFQKNLESEKKVLAEAISKETGKPLWDSLGEVNAMIAKVTISIDAYSKRTGVVQRDLPHAISITRHKPHGVIAVLGPFNFPGHLPNGHIIPALLAGNTVVFKPSELTPAVGELMIRYWASSGVPAGVINMIQGGGDIGKHLSTHSEINGLLFTGSWRTGRQLSEHFGKHPDKILALEMGGNNPLIVSKTQNFQAAAYLTVQSAYLSSGQRCTCARRLIVPKGQNGDKFLETLAQMISLIRVGSYTDVPEPFMGPVINVAAANRLIDAQKNLKATGAIPIIEMVRPKQNLPFVTPGLIDVTSVENREDEEFFGPLLQVIRVENFEEALVEANRTNYGLSAGLLSDEQDEYEYYIKSIKAGCTNWNTPLTGAVSTAPFGGIGHSGNHRPSAFYAADYCAFPVASLENNKVTMPEKHTPGIAL